MDVVYYLASILILAILIAFIVGMIKPVLFQKLLGHHVNRGKITLISVITLVVLFIVVGVAEPETVKQDRLARQSQEQQNKTKQEEQQLKALENQRLQEEAAKAQKQSQPQAQFYEVKSVEDGDTIKVELSGKLETIRFIGIDTPESVHPDKPDECYGQEASDYLKKLLTGKKVKLEDDKTQGDRDKYQRLLRYVYLEDNSFVNKKLLSDGYAFEYTYDKAYTYQVEFKQAQTEADKNDRGLWAANACNGEHKPVSQQTTTSQSQSIQRPTSPAPAQSSQPSNVYYKNCTAARAAGAAPVYRGDPGYGAHLDRDNDGIGCE